MENKIERNERRKKIGIVVSDKMDKTIVVKVMSSTKHPLYSKIITRSAKFKAHDEESEAGIGDKVEIVETKPFSKQKYFRLEKIINKAK